MKRSLLFLAVLSSIAGLATAKTLPPVVLSADAENSSDAGANAPQHYALYVAPYEEFGNVAAGGHKPPAVEEIARLVRAALPTDLYTPISSKSDVTDVVIGVHWGEISPQGPQPFIGAREGGVVTPMWAVTVGRTHVPPFITSSQRSSLHDETTRDRFYLIVSAYDASALRAGKVAIRWQTRTSVDSLQVSSGEAWTMLAAVAQGHLGQRMERPDFVSHVPTLNASADSTPLIPIEEIVPGATKLLTFERAMPPY